MTPPLDAGAESPRRINVLILASSLWIGGAETVMRHLAQSIDRRRFNVTVAYLKEAGQIGPEIAKSGVDVVAVSPRAESGQVDYFGWLKLLRLLRERRIDVVHSHTVDGLMDAGLCRLFRPRTRLLHTFHFGNYPHTRKRLMQQERLFSRLTHRVIAVGDVQRTQLQAVYGFSEEGIGRVWNGVHPPDTTVMRVESARFRESVAQPGEVLVGTIATLIQQKGLQDLMRVARRLLDRGIRAKFVIAGEGRLRPELEALRHELGLDDVVTLSGWVTNAADVALPAFDIFFQPSLWEAMSVVILEAMAAGKPIVATRVGENPHIIANGEDGLLVDARDVDGMADALGTLIQDAGARQRIGDAARAKVMRQFTVEHMTRAYERLYEELAG